MELNTQVFRALYWRAITKCYLCLCSSDNGLVVNTVCLIFGVFMAASKFHIRCSDENNLVSVEVLAKLEKCSALDLYELLLCRSDIVFQV